MKSIILIIIILCNAVYGQMGHILCYELKKDNFGVYTIKWEKDTIPTCIDSVQIWPILSIDKLRETPGYKHYRDEQVDTCWFNKDTTFLIFRYILQPTITNIFYSDDTIFLYKNDHSIDTLFMFQSMDSAVHYYEKKKLKQYPVL